MKHVVKIIVFIGLCSSLVFAQEITREQKLQKLNELTAQVSVLEQDILSPDTNDIIRARKENFEVFRIMPREKYDRKLSIQGGGSYYSFTTKSHDYQKIAQIGLEQNNLRTGFAGANYGFIADLGENSLAEVTTDSAEANFLVNYKPPTNESDVRIEQQRTRNYETAGISYKNAVPAVVGHSYVFRTISFGDADVLVAFNIHRKDADGSLIIFWKLLENYEKPLLARNK